MFEEVLYTGEFSVYAGVVVVGALPQSQVRGARGSQKLLLYFSGKNNLHRIVPVYPNQRLNQSSKRRRLIKYQYLKSTPTQRVNAPTHYLMGSQVVYTIKQKRI
ncbi:hypothetical protein OPQ81_001356 [Rhizoctonia solani]|nr:hypothetical protein OPQ81_001356 [Rhizoctonia solani]